MCHCGEKLNAKLKCPLCKKRYKKTKTGYREFESRLDITESPRGAKTEIIEAAIKTFPNEFTLAGLERACPGISHDMIRKVLRMKQQNGDVECLGRGPCARWEKKR